MFVEERQSLIVQELEEKGRVKVKELSARFNVTEDLIRKDLTSLEEQGKLKKTYGGAVRAKENLHREIAAQRKTLNLEAKRKIAQKALPLIKEGYIIFLDISTSNIELAKLIAENNVRATIVTNMIDVGNILAKSDAQMIFIGGELDYGRNGFVGSLTLEMLKNFRFDISFMGVVGVDVYENSVTSYRANDGLTKREVLKISRNSYMMCECDKLNQLGNYKYAKIDDFSGIILDNEIDGKILKGLKDYGLEIIN